MNDPAKRWAVVSLDDYSDTIAEAAGIGRGKLWIVESKYAAEADVLAAGSFLAMEAALRLLGGYA